MPLLWTSEVYTPELLRANPEMFFVFGDNLQRIGTGGQAVIRHEPNAIGVATKASPGMFFTDDNEIYPEFKSISWHPYRYLIDADLAAVEEKLAIPGAAVVVPLAFIGTGLAALPEKAPGLLFYLYHRFNLFMHKYGCTYETLKKTNGDSPSGSTE
jgi:hypothetical protein